MKLSRQESLIALFRQIERTAKFLGDQGAAAMACSYIEELSRKLGSVNTGVPTVTIH